MQAYEFERAWRCYHRGQYDQGIEILKSLLANDPNIAIFHGLLAATLLRQRRVHAAAFEIQLALAIDPQLPFLLLTLAQIRLYQNRHSDALALCDQVLSSEPESIEAHLLKADLYNLIGQAGQCLTQLQAALSIRPDDVSVLTDLGEFYFSSGTLDKAEHFCREALAQNAQHERANVLMGKVQLKLGNTNDAIYHARFAISQNPNSEAALRLFSDIKMRENWFLGLWWRLNSSLSKLGDIKISIILISGYLIFSLLSVILRDLQYPNAGSMVSFGWLAFVLYSWICLPLYYRQIKQEIDKFQFDKDF